MSDRTFTEGEAYALVADAIARETAAVEARATAAEEQVTTLSNEKDALELRVTAAETAKKAAETELVEFKTGIETQKAQEAKRTERVAAVAAVAPDLKVEGERADRIVAMEDAAFADYVSSLREVAATGPHPFKKGDDGAKCATCDMAEAAPMHKIAAQKAAAEGELPRQSAAFSGSTPGAGSSTKSPVKGLFAARAAAQARTTA